MMTNLKKLYVGCGPDRREGYIHIDKRPLEGVDHILDAWEVYPAIKNVDEIFSRHMLEHLTSMEADYTLRNWIKALRIGGTIHIIVPNMDYHCRQWLDAQWTEDTLQNKWSDARYGFAGIYGWQRQCDPNQNDYEQSYWDVHKSGYNEKRIRFLLERIGYDSIETKIVDEVHLVATARKSMEPGERQISPTLSGIRGDHKARYKFASEIIKSESKILDAACGVGYGSYILHKNTNSTVVGVDISKAAIDYANKNYKSECITFVEQDLKCIQFDAESFDYIVSFETYEHIDFPRLFIENCQKLLKKKGLLILSTPNQKHLPFDSDRFPFHLKHYLYEEVKNQLSEFGFTIESEFSQNNYSVEKERRGIIFPGINGEFLIIVARKSK